MGWVTSLGDPFWEETPADTASQTYEPGRIYTAIIGNKKYGLTGESLAAAGGDPQKAIDAGGMTSSEAYSPYDTGSGWLDKVGDFLTDKGYLAIGALAGGAYGMANMGEASGFGGGSGSFTSTGFGDASGVTAGGTAAAGAPAAGGAATGGAAAGGAAGAGAGFTIPSGLGTLATGITLGGLFGGKGGSGSGSGSVGVSSPAAVPAKSPEELALLNEQAGILRDQRSALAQSLKQQNLLQPALFRQLGLEPTFGPDGQINGFNKAAPTAQEQQYQDLNDQFLKLGMDQLENQRKLSPGENEINKAFQDRTLAALHGELPVDPALNRSLSEEQTNLEDRLRRNLGTGWETSEPGIRAMAEFTKRKNELLEGARRGDLTMAEQIGQSRMAGQYQLAQGALPAYDLKSRLTQQNFGNIFAANQGGLPFVNAGLNTASGFTNPLSFYQMDQTLGAGASGQNLNAQLQAAIASATNSTASRNAMMSGLGQFAGMAAFAPIFGSGKPSLAGMGLSSVFGAG